MNKLKLDIGCGNSKREGFIGVDVLNLDNVDIIHDLNTFPYPFKENSVDEIWLDNVLEHLKEPLLVLEELYRCSKPGAKITVAVPYFRSFYSTIDPTHRNFFGVNWFSYFDPTHLFNQKYQYSHAKFKVNKLEFDYEWNGKAKFFHKYLTKFANKYPWKYEANLSHLFPLNSLKYELQVIK